MADIARRSAIPLTLSSEYNDECEREVRSAHGEGTITDEALEEMRARIGKPMRHLQRSVMITDEWIDRYVLGVAT